MGKMNCPLLRLISALAEASMWCKGSSISGLTSQGFKTIVMSILSDWTFSVLLIMEDISIAEDPRLDNDTMFMTAKKRRF
jgi:hypothetical protein